ncbi:hypothetical protein GF336_02490 [Candidatus Woesearchaeota archaeon]|nr:hypothetical protein [Candidatus Woesearchaeota archaeon]
MNKLNTLIIFLIVLSILSFSASAETLSCTIDSSGSCTTGTEILGISALTNAHAELASQSSYANRLCCWDSDGETSITSSDTDFLKLESSTNSQSEKFFEDNYANTIYMGTADPDSIIECGYASSCPADDTCVLSIDGSGDTNFHLGDCSAYSEKLCCGIVEGGDEVSNQLVNFQDSETDVDIVVNVYSADDPENPNPVSGRLTYTYKITDTRKGSVKKLTVYSPEQPSDIGHVDGTGIKSPVSEGIVGNDVEWDYGNSVYAGETADNNYYASSYSPGQLTIGVAYNPDIFNQGTGPVEGAGSVPEFTTIGLILSVAAIVGLFVFMRLNNKKSQAGSAILFAALVVLIIGAAGILLFEDTPSQIDAYVVKEVMPGGEIVEKEISALVTDLEESGEPALVFSITTEKGTHRNMVVPFESNKKFIVQHSMIKK